MVREMVQTAAEDRDEYRSSCSASDTDSDDKPVAESFFVRHWLLILASLFWVFGVVWYIEVEGMTLVESCYIITQIVTSIGYGDIGMPTTSRGKITVSMYILGMLVLVGYLLNSVVDAALTSEKQKVQERLEFIADSAGEWKQTAQSQLEGLRAADGAMGMLASSVHDTVRDIDTSQLKSSARPEALNGMLVASIIFGSYLVFGTAFYSWYEGCSCPHGTQTIEGCNATTVCEVGKTKTPVDAFYMSVVTLTTVGFGDYTPITVVGRWVGIPWMLSGVVAAANFVSAVQKVLMERQERKQKARRKKEMIGMDVETFASIDKDGDAVLDKHEFVTWMLVQQDLVSQEVIDKLGRTFESLDADGSGKLSFDEVQLFSSAMLST